MFFVLGGMMMKKKLMTVAIIGIAIMTSVANAAIITPVGATASSEFNDTLAAIHLIDGSGWDGTLVDDVQTNEWWSAGAVGEWVQFDLGGATDVGTISVWNSQSFAGDYHVTNVNVMTSSDNGSTFGFAEALALGDPDVLGLGVGENFTVNYSGITHVRFDITAGQQTSLLSLSEVRFDTVPEPMSMALLGLGGLFLRRKKR